MKSVINFFVVSAFSALFLASCGISSTSTDVDGGTASGGAVERAASRAPEIQMNPIAVVPREYVFQRSEVAVGEGGWDELLGTLRVDQKQFLELKNSEYFGSLRFDDPSQFKSLVAQGFLLPTDWLDAESFSDEQLKSLAEGGGVKARMLYADRLIDSAITLLPLRVSDPVAYDEGEGAHVAVAAYAELGKLKTLTSSPFVAYMDARLQYSLSTQPTPEVVAGAMFAAYQRGDKRAESLLEQFASRNPGMDASKIMAVYRSLESSGN